MTDKTHDSIEPSEMTVTNPPDDDAVCVTLPDHLGDEIDRRISETYFDSPDEYVTFVLESLFRELDQQDDDVIVNVHDEDPDDTDTIQNRLESLGYL